MEKIKKVLLWFKNSWTGNIIIVLFIINFLYQSFVIPSGSMRNTLLEGDFVVVNKYAYGITTPRIPWIEEKIFLDLDNDNHIFRGEGPKRKDVVVFRYPKQEKVHFVKRCVAVADDILFLKDKNLYIHFNEGDEWIKENYPENKYEYYVSKKYGIFVKNPYQLEFTGIHNDSEYSDLESSLKYVKENQNYLNSQFEKVKDEDKVLIKKDLFKLNKIESSVRKLYNFPEIDNYNKEEMGNLILLTEDDMVYAQVPKDEWFMMGDNRDHSSDSRYWGSVPYRSIEGKVAAVWFSTTLITDDPNKKYEIQWKRMFKSLDEIQYDVVKDYN